MSGQSYQGYDDFLVEADKDDRVGEHDFLVQQVIQDTWPSGDPRFKVKGQLMTANGASADFTLSPVPPPDVVRSQKASWKADKKKAIASAIRMHKALSEYYGASVDTLKEGDILRVVTVKTKRDKTTGKGGFIRVAAIVAKGTSTAAASTVPF